MWGVLIPREGAACHEGSVRRIRTVSGGRGGLEHQVQVAERCLAGNKGPPPEPAVELGTNDDNTADAARNDPRRNSAS